MPSINLTPTQSGPFAPNDTVTFEVTTSADFPGFFGVGFDLTYNADSLRYVETTFAVPFDDFSIVPDAADFASATGETTITDLQGSFFSPGNEVTGEQTIATVMFEALAPIDSTTVSISIDQDFGPGGGFADFLLFADEPGPVVTVSGPVEIVINEAPIAVDDTAAGDEDTDIVIDVLANDTDPGAGTPDFQAVQQGPSNGTLSEQNGVVTYTPDDNFNGTDSFTYSVVDAFGLTDEATVNITVNAVNDPPDAVNDTASTDKDTPVAVAVLANDDDVDGDTLSISDFTNGTNGSVSNNAGVLTYTPDADFTGDDTFTYTVDDGNGGTDTATVTVTVNETNQVPTATNDTASGPEDTVIVISPLGNDTDPDNDSLTIAGITSGPSSGNATFDATSITYTPNTDFNGTDSLIYQISDGNGGTDTATITITVDPVADDPVAVNDTFSATEDVPFTGNVAANDVNVEPGATVILVSDQQLAAAGAALQLGGDGAFTVTPQQDFNGDLSFDYKIELPDGNNGVLDSNVATATVSFAPVNDPPVANDDSINVNEGATTVVDVLANDVDVDGDDLTITLLSDAGGAATLQNNEVSYTAANGFIGTETFTYEVDDGNGGTDSATVTVTVDSVNDDPVANDDVAFVEDGGSVVVDVLANDSDPNGDTLTISVGQADFGTVAVTSGQIEYTPGSDFPGTDTFQYTVSDGNGGTDSATVTVSAAAISLAPVSSAPVAPGEVIELEFKTSSSFPEFVAVQAALTYNADDLTFLDFTTSEPLEFAIPPDLPDNPSGVTTIAPFILSDFNGTPGGSDTVIATFRFEAISSNTTTVSITGDPEGFFLDAGGNSFFNGTADATLELNAAPVAVNDSRSTDEDESVNLTDLLDNDSDPDGNPIFIDAVGDAANGIVVLETDGTVTYTPDSDYFGADTFEYTISDGGLTSTASVTINVAPANDAPVLDPLLLDYQYVEGDTAPVFQASASDIENDDIVFSLEGADQNLFTIDPVTGDVAFAQSPSFDDGGDNTFEIEVIATDDGQLSDSQTVSISLLKDTDGDLAPDIADNAIAVFNQFQLDTNGDGIGNVIDADFNGDLTVNIQDLLIFRNGFLNNPLPDGVTRFDLDLVPGDVPANQLPATEDAVILDTQDLGRFASLFGKVYTDADTAFLLDIA